MEEQTHKKNRLPQLRLAGERKAAKRIPNKGRSNEKSALSASLRISKPHRLDLNPCGLADLRKNQGGGKVAADPRRLQGASA